MKAITGMIAIGIVPSIAMRTNLVTRTGNSMWAKKFRPPGTRAISKRLDLVPFLQRGDNHVQNDANSGGATDRNSSLCANDCHHYDRSRTSSDDRGGAGSTHQDQTVCR